MNFNDFWYWLSNGTGAEWVSIFLSFGAIIFAYLQIQEQRREYENDKRRENERDKLKHRPYFSINSNGYASKEYISFWLNDDSYDYLVNDSNQDYLRAVGFNDIFGDCIYEFTNVTNRIALNMVFNVKYFKNNKVKYEETINTKSFVESEKNILFFPKILKDKISENLNIELTLYFSTIDDIYYCQKWISFPRNNERVRTYEFEEIEEVSYEKVPKKEKAIYYELENYR